MDNPIETVCQALNSLYDTRAVTSVNRSERDRFHSYKERSPNHILHVVSALLLTFVFDIFVEFTTILSWSFVFFTLEKGTNVCLFIKRSEDAGTGKPTNNRCHFSVKINSCN